MNALSMVAAIVVFVAFLGGFASFVGLIVQLVRGRPKKAWVMGLGASIGAAVISMIVGAIADSPRQQAEQKAAYEQALPLLEAQKYEEAIALLMKAGRYEGAQAELVRAREELKKRAMARLEQIKSNLEKSPEGAKAEVDAFSKSIDANVLGEKAAGEIRATAKVVVALAETELRKATEKSAPAPAAPGASAAAAPAGGQNPSPELDHAPQDLFVAALSEARRQYADAPNEIKKSQMFNGARAWDKAFFAKTKNLLTDWRGEIDDISTSKGGTDLYLRIEVGEKGWAGFTVKFKKGYGFGDRGISPKSPVYEAASNMKEGDCVLFSGKVSPKESSMSESGAMLVPTYEMEFNSLKPCG